MSNEDFKHKENSSSNELSVRNEERIKNLDIKLEELKNEIKKVDEKISDVNIKLNDSCTEAKSLEKIISKDLDGYKEKAIELSLKVESFSDKLNDVKNISEKTKSISEKTESRWNGVYKFVIQLLWVIIASYLLVKLNLNPPPLP